MLERIWKWILGLFGQWALDIAYPDAAKEREAAFAHKDAQTVKDAQTDAEITKITQRQVGRDRIIEQDGSDIQQARKDLATKEAEIKEAAGDPDKLAAIEKVWKVKT